MVIDMGVGAHTNQVGFYALDSTSCVYTRPRTLDYLGNSYEWAESCQLGTIAYSNKGPSTNSDGNQPTNYFRHVGKLRGSSYHAMDDWHESRGQSLRWITLNGYPHGCSYASPGVYIPSWMENKVIQDAQVGLMDLRANIMEDLAQAKQTMSLLVKIFNAIVAAYQFARTGNTSGMRRVLKSFGSNIPKRTANVWLAYYYGIRPLVSTFGAICAAAEPKLKVKKVKRKLSQAVSPDDFASTTGAVTTGSAFQRVQCGITAYLNMDSSLSYWTSLGLTGNLADDALVTAWALTPYSFVVDWVLPVERFLRTRRFTSGITALHSYISRSLVCDSTIRATWLPGLSSWFPWGSLPQANVRASLFQREVYYGAAPPSGLALNLSLSPINLVNAAALIVQRK